MLDKDIAPRWRGFAIRALQHQKIFLPFLHLNRES
jgi:hypothetical protein